MPKVAALLKISTAFLLGFSCLHVQASESAYVVRGSYSSFELPSRPLGSIANYRDFVLSRQNGARSMYGDPLPIARNSCPAITALYEDLYNKIIEANGLTEFVQDGPGISLRIECTFSRTRLMFGLSRGAQTDLNNNVILDSRVALAADSEDEVAFVLGHEIAHALFGHGELQRDHEIELRKLLRVSKKAVEARRLEIVTAHEDIADRFGALLILNTGYNPYSGPEALRKVYAMEPRHTLDWFFDLFAADDGHGSLATRKTRIDRAAREAGFKTPYNPTSSLKLEAAKAEAQRMSPQAD